MRVFRRAVGAGAIVVAGVILSACTAQPDSPVATPAPTTATTTPATATTTPTTVPVEVTPSAQAAKPAPAKVSACASATKATLEAAVKANKGMADALLIDGKGLQGINCAESWAYAHFTNEIDGGHILFAYRNGKWVAARGGTAEVCDEIPAAIAKKICQ
ncbi:hypothetical protein GCM10027258_24640 [Amycolatopsis stemonae]